MSYQTKANLMMVVVSIFWGLSYVFMKVGLDSLQALNIVALRFLIAFLVAGIFFYKRLMKVTVKAMTSSFMLGTLLFGVFTFITIGVSMTSASNAGFLVSLAVIFVPIIHSVLVKRLPSWGVRIGLVVTLVGIGLLTLKSSLSINTGDLLCIFGALCYATHIILTGKLTKQNDSITLGVLQLGFAGVLALICSIIFENPSLPATFNAWVSILGLGILCSAVGFICQAVAQKYITPTLTGLIFALEPVTAAIFAILLLNEPFTLKDFIGCWLVILGILVAQLNKKLLLKVRGKLKSYQSVLYSK